MVRKKKEFINVSKQIGSLTFLIQNMEMGGRRGQKGKEGGSILKNVLKLE